MKVDTLRLITTRLIHSVIILMTVAVFFSCAKKVSFQSSSVVPAATGSVKIKKDKNKNYGIQVNVTNLAEPGKLQPPRNYYLVWMVSDENQTRNMGQINTSSGLLSKKLKASFKTTTPFKPSKFFITAEDDKALTYPGSQVVLTTDSF